MPQQVTRGYFFEPSFPASVTDAASAPTGATTSNGAQAVGNPVAILSTRLSKLSLEEIARALGKDDTAACKVRSGERACSVSDMAKLIGACGLKLVDKDRYCVKREEFNFMRSMTARALANEQVAQQLTFDDPE